MTGLLDRIRRGDRLAGDGAWGTMLIERGLRPGTPPESFVLEKPDAIREIARAYLEAGAEIVTTDTFGATTLNLAAYGLAERADEINCTAVALVREAVGGRALVSASVGPTGRLLAPMGDTQPREVRAAYERQIDALAAAGADVVCIETMTDLTEAMLAVEAARAVAPGLPVMATMTFDPTPRGFFTIMGVSVEQAARGLADAGASVIGSNCGNGIERMVEIARELRRVSALPLVIQANAGLPETRAGRLLYPETPTFMASHVPALLAAGVSIVGGCCGTSPEHVRALRAALTAGARA